MKDFPSLYHILKNTFGERIINGSKEFQIPDYRNMFLRGYTNGRNFKIQQNDSTSMPKNPFSITQSGDHSHEYSFKDLYTFSGTPYSCLKAEGNNALSERELSVSTRSSGGHVHPIVGGDNETRPNNYAINFIIKC